MLQKLSIKLPLGFVILSLAIVLQGCTSLSQVARLESPSVTLVDLQLESAGLFEQRFTLLLRVVNPNNEDLPVSGFNYQLNLDGHRLAKGATNEPLLITALGESLVEVGLTSSMLDWARYIHQWRKQGGIPESMEYVLSGKLFLSHGLLKSLPFSRDGTVPIRWD